MHVKGKSNNVFSRMYKCERRRHVINHHFRTAAAFFTYSALILAFQIVAVILGSALALPQSGNPCEPNPCGENNICNANGGAVSCECEPGYGNNDPSDPWKCTRNTGGPVQLNDAPNDHGSGLLDIPSRTSQNSFDTVSNEDNKKQATTTDRPFFLPPKETVIGFDESGREVVFTSAVAGTSGTAQQSPDPIIRPIAIPNRPIITNPIIRNKNIGSSSSASSGGHRLEGLDVDEIFNAECLSSDDCANNDYCNIKVNLCQDACTLNVCGHGALCKGKLHRSLCYCPKGYDGNPHEKCNKAKSRAGTKFRKRR